MSSSSAAIAVPLERLESVVFPLGQTPPWQPRLRELHADRPDSEDRVLLANDDVLRGLITAIDDQSVDIEVAGAPRKIPRESAVAALMVPLPLESPEGLRAVVDLCDRSRAAATFLRWTTAGIAIHYLGAERRIDAAQVARIEIHGGRWVPLTSISPVSVENTAMMEIAWDFRDDRDVTGGVLQVGDETFAHGIGVHSRSLITYPLADKYVAFVTRYGLDRSAGPFAAVEVEIRVDGRPVVSREIRKADGLCGPVRIPINWGRILDLVVDFGPNGAIQDRFDWIEPGLVRESTD